VGNNLSTQFSDDPDTELFGDRTALLLRSHCTEENYLRKWELWLERLSGAKPLLSPVLLSPGRGTPSGSETSAIAVGGAGAAGIDNDNEGEELKSKRQEEAAWVLFGDLDKDPETKSYLKKKEEAGRAGEASPKRKGEGFNAKYRDVPRYAFFGAGELDIGSDDKAEVFVELDYNSKIAGGAGGIEKGESGVYIQKYPDLPYYAKISGNKLERIGLSRADFSNICGKEYLPFIMDVGLFGSYFSSKTNKDISFLRLFKTE